MREALLGKVGATDFCSVVVEILNNTISLLAFLLVALALALRSLFETRG